MTREQAKELLPIIQAFAEGKKIETRYDIYDWTETEVLHLESKNEYRIKPKPKYRPFKTQEECWNEMLKHKPFGWIVHTLTEIPANISMVTNKGITIDGNYIIPYQEAFNNRTFTDGTPFGIKEE